jgi:heat-inducible transcriptional repressor
MSEPRTPPGTPLDERKESILRAIIEAYIRSGEPVGSKSVADGSELGVSSATVRNEMGTLEREGYVSHPHTSAGRVPTDKGYRYYVDVLAPSVRTDPKIKREIEGFLLGTVAALDDLLKRASTLLADLTDLASLAAEPPADSSRLRHLQVVPLGGYRLFLIFVGQIGWHEERIVELDAEPSEEDIRRAVEAANAVANDKTLTEAAEGLDAVAADEPVARILRAAAEAMRHVAFTTRRVHTAGTSRVVVWEPAPVARRVLELLEGGGVEPLIVGAEPEEMAVRIGSELGLQDLEDLSLIAAGYRYGRRAGALGVLGPTRMDYPTVIATVAEVAGSLTRALRRLESS